MIAELHKGPLNGAKFTLMPIAVGRQPEWPPSYLYVWPLCQGCGDYHHFPPALFSDPPTDGHLYRLRTTESDTAHYFSEDDQVPEPADFLPDLVTA